MYTCPTLNCKTSSKYKYNIVKHLKSCYKISKKKKRYAKKVCDVRKKTFAKKFNRDIYIRQFHGSQFQISDEVSDENATDYEELNNDVPPMVATPRFFLENNLDGIATDRYQLNNDVPTYGGTC